MPALGERFRAAREARGLSLSEISEQIRIRSVYLAAIEDENWAAIGAPVYIRGFLKTYARFLGLDADEVVASFTEQGSAPVALDASEHPGYPSRQAPVEAPMLPARNLSPYLWLAGVVAVVLVAFVVYNALTLGHRAPVVAIVSAVPLASTAPTLASSPSPGVSPSPSAGLSPTPEPSPSPASSSSPASSASPAPSTSPGSGGPNTVQVVLSAPSWVRVTVDGNVRMEGTFAAGTARLFHGKTARLRIGNAGGVTIYVDGKSVGKLGADGDVIDRTFSL